MVVECNTEGCDWHRSSASDLARLSFVFDHGPEAGHRFASMYRNDWKPGEPGAPLGARAERLEADYTFHRFLRRLDNESRSG